MGSAEGNEHVHRSRRDLTNEVADGANSLVLADNLGSPEEVLNERIEALVAIEPLGGTVISVGT